MRTNITTSSSGPFTEKLTDCPVFSCYFKGDKLMRLPSYSYDKDDLARHLSVAAEGPEEVIEADEYLQPQPTTPQSADSSKVP